MKESRIKTRYCQNLCNITIFFKMVQNQPNFFPLKLFTDFQRSSAKWGPILCENILQCGCPYIGGNRLFSPLLSKKSSYFYLIAYYIPIWEVVQTLVFPIKFHGLKIFFSTFELPQVVLIVPFCTVSNFEPNLILLKTPPTYTVLSEPFEKNLCHILHI